MKKILITALILTSSLFMLSSCFFFDDFFGEETLEITTDNISVYDADKVNEDIGYLDTKYKEDKVYFIKEQELIPYLSLNQYCSYLTDLFEEGTTIDYQKGYKQAVITIKKADEAVFAVGADLSNRYFLYAGQPPIKEESGTNSMYLGFNYQEQVVSHQNNYYTYSFAYLDLSVIEKNNEYFFPLGLIDTLFNHSTGIGFTYYQNKLFRFSSSVDSLSKKDKDDTSIMEYIAHEQGENPFMPDYLRIHNREVFYFAMDNFYGLASVKGINSMKDYYRNSIYEELLISKDNAVRGQAYYDALNHLSDGHTGLSKLSPLWNETVENKSYGKLWDERVALRNQLAKERQEVFYQNRLARTPDEEKDNVKLNDPDNAFEILYSSDNKTAFFSFDSFIATNNPYKDGSFRNLRDDLYKVDSFFLFIHQLEEIKSKGGVENVIIDISTNGGGMVGILAKLLALLSSNNESYIYFFTEGVNALSSLKVNVDVDLDNTFSSQETYGGDFNYYILTSPYSFSCGNAFPIACQKANIAKVIGQRSGGGECSVGQVILPNGMTMAHSSLNHLGWYDEDEVFEGFEGGAVPDIQIDYKDYFDIEKLVEYIK